MVRGIAARVLTAQQFGGAVGVAITQTDDNVQLRRVGDFSAGKLP